jgi:hypothetical protein
MYSAFVASNAGKTHRDPPDTRHIADILSKP